MAWVGILIGSLAGAVMAVLGFAVWDWPLWLCLLAYPGAGAATTLLVITFLAVNRPPAGPGGPQDAGFRLVPA